MGAARWSAHESPQMSSGAEADPPRYQAALGAIRSWVEYGFAGVIGSATWFLVLPLLSRYWSTEDFGLAGLLVAAVGLVSPFVGFNGHLYLLWEGRGKARVSDEHIASATVRLAVASGAVLGLLAYPVVRATGASGLPYWAVLTVMGIAVLTAFLGLFETELQLQERSGTFLRYRAVVGVGISAGTVGLALAGWGWEGRLASHFVLALLVGTLALRNVKGALLAAVRGRVATGTYRSILRFGVPLIPHVAGLWLVNFVDRYLLAAYADLGVVGVYTVAYGICMTWSSAHDGVARWFAPRLSAAYREDSLAGKRSARRFLAWYSAGSIGSSLVLVYPVGWAVALALPLEYQSMRAYLWMLLLGQGVAGVARIATGWLYALGRSRERMLVSVATALISVGLSWAFIQSRGASGAALATLATYTVSAVVVLWLVRAEFAPDNAGRGRHVRRGGAANG